MFDISEERLSRIKSVVNLPLSEKINKINTYLEKVYPDKPPLSLCDIEGHIGKETLITCIYLGIHKPHSID